MVRPTVVVYDGNAARRAEVYRTLAQFAHAIPISEPDDLGNAWPERAWFFIPDDPAMLETLCCAMMARGTCRPIVVYSEKPQTDRAIAAILGGAVNYLPWPSTPQVLEAGLRQISPAAERRIKRIASIWDAQAQLARLTNREREVLSAIRRGLSNKEAAQRLGISPRTVEIHRANALRRLGVANTIAAISLIIEVEQLDQLSLAA